MSFSDFEPDFAANLAPADDALVFVSVGRGMTLWALPNGELPSAGQCRALFGEAHTVLRIGCLEGQFCWLMQWRGEVLPPPDWQKIHLRTHWGRWSAAQCAALNRASQLATFLQQHQFCGVCGHALRVLNHEPAMHCVQCDHRSYPRLSPVCMGLVVNGDQVLLGRSPHFLPEVYSALAGFIEAGESLEDGLRREIREEVGVEIGAIRYFGSQSWPYPHSLMIGFFAEYASGDIVLQPTEIEDARWFSVHALPKLPNPSSIAFQMIDHWRRSRLGGESVV